MINNTNQPPTSPETPPPIPPAAPGKTPTEAPNEAPKEIPKIDEIEKIKQSITGETAPTTATNIPAMPPGGQSDIMQTILNFAKNPKLIIGVIIGIVIIAIGAFFYHSFFYNIGKLAATFDQIPDSVTINEQTYDPDNQLNLNLKPGTYTINITKDKFFPVQTSFTIEPQQTTNLSLAFTAYPVPREVIDFPTSFPDLAANESEISYLSNFGTTFYRVNLTDYTKDVISPNTFNHIDQIFWGPTAKKACIIQSTNNVELLDFQSKNILYQKDRRPDEKIFHFYDFSKYDLTSQTHFVYSEKIKNPSWHPTKEEIIYHYIDYQTGENSLSKSKPNLDNKEVLYDLDGFNDAIVKYSPDTELVAVVDTKPTDQSVSNIYIFDTISRKFELIPTKDVYTNFLWSPDSQYLIGIKNNSNTSLINVATFDTIDLPFSADIDHLAWLNNSTQIIVAVTSPNASDQLILYDTIAAEPIDLAYTTDIEFGTISHPIVSRDDTLLYFLATDKNHLYSLEIQTLVTDDVEILPQ